MTVLLESCFSGNSESGPLIRSASPIYVKSTLPVAASGITVLAAARNDQIASWDHGARLGLFTHYLTRALYGEADGGRWGNGDGNVTLGEVEAFLDDEMTYAARRQHQRVQQSTLSGDRHRVVATVTALGAPPRLASIAGPRKPPKPPAPPRRVLDGSLATAQSFTAENQRAIQRSIKTYYRAQGTVWDGEVGDTGGGSNRAMYLEKVHEVKALLASGDTIDLDVSYDWMGDNIDNVSVFADARMRLEVTADGMKITKMWR